MSWNVVIRDSSGLDRYLLTRANVGITHSATMSKGDKIRFGGVVEAIVDEVVHTWQPPGSEKSPVTVAHCLTTRPLSDKDEVELLILGFKKLGTADVP